LNRPLIAEVFALIFGKLDVGGKIEEAASPILVKLAVFPENREDKGKASSNFPENGAFRQNSGSSFVYFIHPKISATRVEPPAEPAALIPTPLQPSCLRLPMSSQSVVPQHVAIIDMIGNFS